MRRVSRLNFVEILLIASITINLVLLNSSIQTTATMPSVSEKAKIKYQEVLEQAKVNNAHRKYQPSIYDY